MDQPIDTEDRYNKLYEYGDISFFLEEPIVNYEDGRFLLLKIVEQAIRDYVIFFNFRNEAEKYIWLSAQEFLFNQDHTIEWGSLILSLEDVLDIVDLDIEWLRGQVTLRVKNKYGDNFNEKINY